MKTDIDPIIVEQTFDASIQSVWDAITQIDHMHQWYFENIPSFKAEVGFKTQFPVINEGRTFTHMWEVTEVVPLKRIAYRWQYKEYTGEGLVIFELSEQDDGTQLTLINTGLDTFPDNIPEFTRESCIGGWEYFIQNRLQAFLQKNH